MKQENPHYKVRAFLFLGELECSLEHLVQQ